MRSLKAKQYKHRFNKFQETFDSTFSDWSEEYDRDVGSEFNKVLVAENIAPVDWRSALGKALVYDD